MLVVFPRRLLSLLACLLACLVDGLITPNPTTAERRRGGGKTFGQADEGGAYLVLGARWIHCTRGRNMPLQWMLIQVCAASILWWDSRHGVVW